MPRISKVNKVAGASRIISGLSKHFAPGIRHRVGGKSCTQREMIAVFQSHLDAIREVEAARAVLTVAVQKEESLARRVKALSADLRAFIAGGIGEKADVLAGFGWEPAKKRGPKTLAGKRAGVQKRLRAKQARD
jgi:hypothetical protein